MSMVPAEGIWIDGVYHFPMRVYYEDTDLGGMMYHARYVSFLERVRSESIRGTAADVDPLLALSEEDGGPIVYVVSKLELNYKRQAKVGDILIGHSRVTRLRAAAIELEQWITCEGQEVVTAKLVVAIVDANTGRPRRWPSAVRNIWAGWCADET